MSNDETYFEKGREYYRANDNPVWPGRHREHPSAKPGDQEHLGKLVDTKYVKMMLNRLDELEAKTRPSAGASSADGKDLAAFGALLEIQRFTKHVAGWAINHQVGLALEGMKFVPLQPRATKNHPQYLSQRALVDDHIHEKAGAVASFEGDDDPLLARKALLNLLRANPGAIPTRFLRDLIESLEALDYGEVRPLLTPINSGRKRNLTELRLQLRAIGLIQFRRGMGLTKERAVDEVASAMGVGHETVKSWENRLKNEFGALEVERTKELASISASWEVQSIRKARNGTPEAKPGEYAEGYDEEALVKLANEYRSARLP